MNEIKESFGFNGWVVATQIMSLIHLILASVATAAVLRSRKELGLGVVPSLLIAWLVPCLGPVAVLVGLRDTGRKRAV